MRVYLKLILSFFFVWFMLFDSFGQEEPDSIRVVETDSMIFVRLEQVDVYPRTGRKLNYRRYSRMVEKIRKVYPFAIAAANELEIYNQKFENAESEREKRKYVKHVEKDLFAQHENELKRFTITEGRYLMLLIDRETGNTSYSIIKEVKGGLPAVFWQGIAKIFNNDLKEEYDPQYKHYVVEQIVLMIEQEYKQNAVKQTE
ncbi:MAG: DUF4294 domain-containing protein [Prolixibacteraceae bacterium]|jgi:hypothetical protein|nr:DUF4294 domain-containing protein [Prolixibacteraceae bacterium]